MASLPQQSTTTINFQNPTTSNPERLPCGDQAEVRSEQKGISKSERLRLDEQTVVEPCEQTGMLKSKRARFFEEKGIRYRIGEHVEVLGLKEGYSGFCGATVVSDLAWRGYIVEYDDGKAWRRKVVSAADVRPSYLVGSMVDEYGNNARWLGRPPLR